MVLAISTMADQQKIV